MSDSDSSDSEYVNFRTKMAEKLAKYQLKLKELCKSKLPEHKGDIEYDNEDYPLNNIKTKYDLYWLTDKFDRFILVTPEIILMENSTNSNENLRGKLCYNIKGTSMMNWYSMVNYTEVRHVIGVVEYYIEVKDKELEDYRSLGSLKELSELCGKPMDINESKGDDETEAEEFDVEDLQDLFKTSFDRIDMDVDSDYPWSSFISARYGWDIDQWDRFIFVTPEQVCFRRYTDKNSIYMMAMRNTSNWSSGIRGWHIHMGNGVMNYLANKEELKKFQELGTYEHLADVVCRRDVEALADELELPNE